MNRIWILPATLAVLAVACLTPTSLPPDQGEIETIVAGTLQAVTPAQAPEVTAAPVGIPFSGISLSLILPSGLAGGMTEEAVAEVGEDQGAPWDVAPAHTRLSFQGYPLQGKFFEPGLRVYPADAYEAANPSAAQSLAELRAILADPSRVQDPANLPTVPGFNAARVFAAGVQIVPFQNGNGVRMLTQFAQYFAPANNHELFYNYIGLTADGMHLIIAILPVNAPFLAADDRPESPVPADGIPLPASGPDEAYYAAVVAKLNATGGELYTPSLPALDALIESITIP